NHVLGQLAVIATDRTRGAFSEIRRIRVIDADHLAEAQNAIARSWTRDFDEAYRLEVGRMLQARYICSGRVSLPPSRCRNAQKLDVQVVNVTLDLKVLEVSSGTIVNDEAVTIGNHELTKNLGVDHDQAIFSLASDAVDRAAHDAVREV